jgi:YaaC-like protein
VADWNQFLFLESTTNLKPLVKRLTGRTPSTAVARGIAVCLQQGRLFYQSAAQSPPEIRPLLLFYGTMAFARAVTAAVECVGLEALPQSHGVKDVTPNGAVLSDLLVRIEPNGTFARFNDVVANRNQLKVIGRGLNFRTISLPAAQSADLQNLQLSLKDILARTPTLANLYVATFGEPAYSEQMILDQHAASPRWNLQFYDVTPLTDRTTLRQIVESLRTRFPILTKWRLVEAARAWDRSVLKFVNVPVPANELDEQTLGEFELRFVAQHGIEGPDVDIERILSPLGGGISTGASHVLIAPLAGQYLSEYSLQYLGMFLLSSLVRYRPATWVHALTRSITSETPADDHALALVMAFMDQHVYAVTELVVETLNPSR